MCKFQYLSKLFFWAIGYSRWIQTSCPRLSIDWGAGFQTPILTPYEVCSNDDAIRLSCLLFSPRQWLLFVKSNGKIGIRWISIRRIVLVHGHRIIPNTDHWDDLERKSMLPTKIKLHRQHATIVRPPFVRIKPNRISFSLFFLVIWLKWKFSFRLWSSINWSMDRRNIVFNVVQDRYVR